MRYQLHSQDEYLYQQDEDFNLDLFADDDWLIGEFDMEYDVELEELCDELIHKSSGMLID